jgi:cell wall-associated NlpC family hydrolase
MIGAATLLGSMLLAPAPGSANPAAPQGPQGQPARPTISSVQDRLQVLDRRGEIASEAYNTVNVRMHQAQARMTELKTGVERQRTRVATLRRDLVGAALSDYASTGGLSPTISLLLSRHPGQFINALATTAVVEHEQAGMLSLLQQQQKQLGVQERQAERELSTITADRSRLAAHKAALAKSVQAAQKLLAQLKAKQRQRVLALQRHDTTNPSNYTPPSRGTERPPSSPGNPTGRAAVAVATALAQLGKPYVYGAAGPDAFDCSGLTMYSWAAAGVSLSHSSAVQSGTGVPVSISELQPGDLVFYYSPVSHVAMYIGNGQVVHAPHTGSVVQIVPLTSMPIAWARRVG